MWIIDVLKDNKWPVFFSINLDEFPHTFHTFFYCLDNIEFKMIKRTSPIS